MALLDERAVTHALSSLGRALLLEQPADIVVKIEGVKNPFAIGVIKYELPTHDVPLEFLYLNYFQ